MAELTGRARATIAALSLITISAIIAACGGAGSGAGGGGGIEGSGVSPQVVSGVAATGAPLAGQVSLKDSASAPKEKTTVIGIDGSFAVDVSDMTAPYLLKATGTVGGASISMYSFADQPGTANINPLSSAALASAAEVDDPAEVYERSDSAMRDKIKSRLPAAVAALRGKLKPLLDAFDVEDGDPIKDEFRADHTGLDAVFDNVNVAISGGALTITNATTGAVIFTARVKDIEHGEFTQNDDHMPKRGPRPAAPTGVSATGGDGQVTIDWEPVNDAISYTIYWSTKNIAASDEGAKKIRHVARPPYVQTGLAAGTTYYYTVRAVNRGGRSPHSDEVSATTNAATAPPTPPAVPAAPAGVAATGGTNQTTISWAAVTGAASYNLYWSTATGVTTANGTKISDVTSPAVHAGLTEGTTYFYVVTAINSAGESAASVQVEASTLGVAPTTTTTTAAPTTTTAAPTTTTAAPTTTTAPPTTTTAPPTTTTTTTASTTTTTLAPPNGAALYTQYCSGCHGGSLDPANGTHVLGSDKQGATTSLITGAIGGVGAMRTRFNATTGTLIKLTPEQIAAISAALQ